MKINLTHQAIKAAIAALFVFFCMELPAQTNNGINYQAVIRNPNNSLVANRQVKVRISILKSNINGQTVYSELHQAQTNPNGLVSIEIGSGSVLSGDINSIAWHEGPFFIKSETAPNGDNDFSIVGTSKIMNTPLSLHSKTADKLVLPNAAAGDMMYFDGTNWVRIPKGSAQQILVMSSSGVPVWQNLTGYSVPAAPSVTTLPATEITNYGGQLNAIANPNGYFSTLIFEYGPTASYGSELNASPASSSGDTNVTISASLTGLTPFATIHYRVKATNINGTSYSEDMVFTTLGYSPTITDQPVSNILSDSATFNCIVNPRNAPTVVYIEYGNSPSLGQSIAINTNPLSGNSNVALAKPAPVNYPIGTIIYYRYRATSTNGTSYSQLNSFIIRPAIGEYYGGGLVFYVGANGSWGLVCSLTDQSENATWGCSGTQIGATSTAIGFGTENTLLIVSACNDANSAARICDDLVLNGFDDWYLPSNEEMALVYSNLKMNGLGNFATARYWTSTEFNGSLAYDCLFYTGEINTFSGSKTNQKHVRAVRTFGD